MAITQTFNETPISGVTVNNPTSLQIGPDGRLYVSQQNGIVKVYDLTVDANGWQATNEQTIELVNQIPNHDDDGALSGANNRQVTGLAVWENAQGEIEIYVTSSDPRIGAGGGGNDANLDTNSGIISRLTFNDATGSWEKTDLVIGLPRSEENHSTNGLALRVENVDGVDKLIAYVTSGGFDNKGAPSNNFAYTPEYYYSAAILRVDVTALETMEADLLNGGGLKGGTSYVDPYVYALPTLDDPTRENSNALTGEGGLDGADIDGNGTIDTAIDPANAEAADTFGGNDGRNQAKFDADGPVQIYSTGYRNHYDITITPEGNIYSFDNGPNNGWGDEPIDANGNVVTSTTQTATNAPDTLLNDASDPTNSDSAPDNLHLVTEGFYAGHANPTRASGADAGLWSGGGGGLSFETQLTDKSDTANDPNTVWDDLPADWNTINGGLDNPQEGVWISPGGSGSTKGPDGSLFKIGSSSNGLTAYTAEGITDSAGAEVLAVASFNGNITFMEIASDGTQAGSNVTASSTVFVGGTPLDVWAIGQGGLDGAGTGAGSVVVAKFGANAITVLEPGNPVGPDVDADDDGILDEVDPLQFDPANGTEVGLAGGETLFWDLNPGDAGIHPQPDGPYNIGMTGWMIDGSGEINPDTQIDDPSVDLLTDLGNTIRGGAPGIFQVKTVTEGTALGTANTQNDALQAGFAPDETVQDFTLRVPILNPFSSNANDTVAFGESASMGVSLGDGSQSNFLGVFVTATNVAGDPVVPAIRVVHEEGDSILVDQVVDGNAQLANLASGPVDEDQIELFLKVDMSDLAAITVQAQVRYQENGAFTTAEPIDVGTPITLASDSALAQVLRGENTVEGQPSATVLTMLATSAGAADAFTADFLDVEVSSSAFPATTIENVTTQADLDSSGPTRGVDTVDYDGSGTLTVPEGYENLDLTDNATDGATVTMNSGDNLIESGPGAHIVNLGGGSDTVTGSAGDLDGDTIGDFAEDDRVVLQGASGAQIVSAVAGSAIIGIDTSGDGLADTTVTFAGEVDPASIVGTDDGTDFVLTLDPVEIVRYRVNAGGQEVAALDEGPVWAADTEANNSVYLSDPGSNDTAGFVAVEPGATVPSTTPGVIFDTERWDDAGGTEMAWAFDAEPGTYEVRLYMGNGFSGTSAAGERVFDVSIEGTIPTNLDDIDLSQQFGHQVGAMISNTVTVDDGTLNLEFLHGVENPLINGIEIVQIGGTPPADTTDPTVGSIEATAALETPGNDLPIDVTVVVTDETGVDVDSITSAALTASAGTVDGTVNITGADGDTSVSVVFQVNAPSGGWPIGEEITFTVDGITDTSGNAIAPASDSLTFLAAPAAGEVLYRVNTGGPELAAADGSALAWAQDTGTFGDAGNSEYLTALSTGTSTFDNSGSNGVAVTSYDPGIAASAPDALFNTERYDPPTDPEMQWSFPVADGDYVVNLFFAEVFNGITAAGERVFDVAVEGSVPTAFNDIDQYATAGPGGAFMLSDTVTVADGALDLEFLHGVENPAIKGIEIVAAGTFDGSTVSIAPPSPATVEETGDTGTTTLAFPVTFDTPPSEDVTVEYAVDINGSLTTGLTQPLGQSDGAITVEVANDDLANGPEDVTVTLTGIAVGTAAAIVGTASAGATVTEDDTAPGEVVVAVNAGGPALTQDGIDFTADQDFVGGQTYTDNTAGNGEQAAFDGTVYETERYDPSFAYEIPVEAGIYDVELHFAEIFQSNPGDRVFDVLVEGQTVLEDFDILAEAGDINTPLVKLFEDVDPATAGNAAAIDVQFQVPTDTGVDNAKVSGIVIRDASVPAPTGGAATLTINDGADGIETSNFGNGSFSITNVGTKDISFIELDVTDALLPDAVFDPFGLAGDEIGKQFTLNGGDGGTGLIAPTDTDGDGDPYDADAIGELYIGTGGAAGFETIRLEFSDFNPGESISFGVDMDPNSIAGADKSILDSGAQLDGAGQWDVGGIGGGELAGSTFTVGYSDATGSVGKLHGQGPGSQMGAEALSSQDSPELAVNLTVNGLGEGAEGSYGDGGPEILIEGPAGETARVLVAKGFIVPFTNEFADTNGDTFDPVNVYHDRLDQQMQALEASGFPANNMVEMLYVDVLLTGEVQDISAEFDFSQVAAFDLSVPDQTNEFGTLVESQLPLGILASVVDTTNDQPKGPVTSPIHLTFAENAAPTIDPVADVEINEFQEASFAVSASDAEGDPIALSATVTRDIDGTVVDPASYSFTDNGDGTASFSWATGEADDGAYTVTLTADDGSSQTTQTVALQVNETADVPGTVLYRVNAGGQEAAAGDGGAAWSADTQANNSPYLVNPGSNNVFPTNGTPKAGVDLSQVSDTAVTAEVIGIERWDNTTDANGEMAWSFDVPAGTEVEVRLYLAELFTGLDDLDGSGDPTGDRIFDVSVDGAIPVAFDDLDPYSLGGNAFDVASVVSHTVTSDGAVDLEFIHVSENPAIKGIELLVAGEPDTAGPTATLVSAPDVSAPGTSYQFAVEFADDSGVDVDTLDGLDVTVTGGGGSFTAAASLVSVDVAADGSPRTATYEIAPPEGAWDAGDNGTYTIALNPGEVADILGNTATGEVLGTFDVAVPQTKAAALIEITPDSGLDASTFSNNSFQITNTSDTGTGITSVSFDLSSGILPDMVFDPTGSGGDATANPFTPNSGSTQTGLVAPADPASDPFSQPRNGGFDVLTIDFTDFDPGEQFQFTTDVDPNSIQGVSGAGQAGAVSGYELVGSTVTVTFSDGRTLTGTLYEDGSLGGGQALLDSDVTSAAPTIELLDAGGDEAPLPGSQVTVSGAEQVVRVTGTAGEYVSLLQMDARLFIASGDPAFDVSAEELPFYANEAMAGKAVYTAQIGADGFVDIPVTLLETDGGTTPDGGLNHFVAVTSPTPYAVDQPTGPTSNTLVVKQGAPLVYDVPGLTTFDGTAGDVIEIPHGPEFEIPQGTIAFSFTAADTSGAQGLVGKDASGFTGGGNHFVLYLDDDTLTARFQDGSASAIFEVPGIAAGQTYEVAATFGPAGVELWLDGNLVGTDALVMDWTQNAEFLQWGGRGWASATGEAGFDAPFEGTMADLQIYAAKLGASEIAALAATASGPNTPPVAADDAVSLDEDGTLVIDTATLLANDDDSDGDPLSVSAIATAPANGTALLDAAAGTITYTPDADYNGTDSFTITVSDGQGGFDDATVSVTVNPVNDDPVAADDTATTVLETAVEIDVLANDSDVDGDTLQIATLGTPANGSVSQTPDGTVTYTPDAGYVGGDSFTYTVDDGAGGTSQTATVTVDVLAAPNTPPVAAADSVTVQEDGSVTFQPGANDADDDGDTVVASAIAADPANGTAVVETDGTVTYTPNPDFNGPDSFEVTVTDGNGGFDTASVSVTVEPVNDIPVAADDAASTGQAAPVVIDLLANDSDVDGDSLAIVSDSLTDPANGTVVDNGNGTVTYTPDAGFAGDDTFDYTVTDGQETATASVTVSVTAFPEPLVETLGETVFDGTSGSVVELPHDPIYEIQQGTIAFSFTANDLSGDQGLFTKDASGFGGGGNHFVAYLDGGTLKARFQDGSTSALIEVPGITAGQPYDVAATFGPDGVGLWLDGAQVGSSDLVMDWTQNVEYLQWGARGWASQSGQPGFDAPFDGVIADRQIYDVTLTESQIAELHSEAPANVDPAAVDDTIVVDEDSSVAFDPTVNDTDIDSTDLIADSVANAPANGTVNIAPDGTVTYTPDPDFFGTDSFDLVIADGDGGFDTSNVAVTVNGIEDAPVANDDTATAQIGAPVVIDLLANDSDPDGDSLAIVNGSLSDPANGTLTDHGDGTVTYTPASGFTGEDSFSYAVTDGNTSATANVSVTVSDGPVLPTPVFEQPGISSFSGSSGDVANYAPDAALEIPAGTIAFSFIADDPADLQGLVAKDASGFVGSGNHFAAYLDNGDLNVRFQDGSSSQSFTFDNVLAGQEYEVAAVFQNGGGVGLYVDGTLVGEDAAFTMNWEANEQYLQVGGLGWASSSGGDAFTAPFDGQMADVEIYDQALDQDAIQALSEESAFDWAV